MRTKAVIFDMDGVLIDSEPGYNRAAADLFGALGLPFGPREIAAVTGKTGRLLGQTVRSLCPGLALQEEDLARLYMDRLYRSLTREVHGLIPGVSGWMRKLKAMGVPMALGSSSTRRMVSYAIGRFALDAYIRVAVTGDDAARSKPEPDIFLLAAHTLRVPPADCLVVEDSPNGIAAARAAGMICAAFSGANRHGLDLSAANRRFTAFDDAGWAAVMR